MRFPQIHGARAMLGTVRADPAGRASPSATIVDSGATDPRASTSTAIRRVLEAADVIVVAENGAGPGVQPREVIGTEGQG